MKWNWNQNHDCCFIFFSVSFEPSLLMFLPCYVSPRHSPSSFYSCSSFIPSSHIANKNWKDNDFQNFMFLPWNLLFEYRDRDTYKQHQMKNKVSKQKFQERREKRDVMCEAAVNCRQYNKKNSRSSRVFHLFPCEPNKLLVNFELSGHRLNFKN
jgi:hypothetical protein